MRWSLTRWLAGSFALVLGANAMLTGCSRSGGEEDPVRAESQVPVRLARVETRAFNDRIDAPGQWRSAGERIVAAPFEGVVDTLLVQVGDHVSAGARVGSFATLESHAAFEGARLLEREASTDAARAEARKAVELARHDRVRVPLISNSSGIVVRRAAEPGAQLASGAEVIAVAPSDRLVFEAHVAARDAVGVRVGQRAEIRDDAGAPRAATIQRILPATDPADQTTLVWLAAAPGGPSPLIGRFGTAEIVMGSARRGAGIPDSAVVQDDLTGETRIAVVDSSGRAHWVAVTLGGTAGGWRELRGFPLPAGTRIVVQGQRGLPDSTRVTETPGAR